MLLAVLVWTLLLWSLTPNGMTSDQNHRTIAVFNEKSRHHYKSIYELLLMYPSSWASGYCRRYKLWPILLLTRIVWKYERGRKTQTISSDRAQLIQCIHYHSIESTCSGYIKSTTPKSHGVFYAEHRHPQHCLKPECPHDEQLPHQTQLYCGK